MPPALGRYTLCIGATSAFLGISDSLIQPYPFFSNNRLLVTDGVFYRYVNETGVIDDSRYTKAYPFSNGYASCYTYENLEKRKSPYYLLLNKNMEMMNLTEDFRCKRIYISLCQLLKNEYDIVLTGHTASGESS